MLPDTLSATFAALADPTRRAILARLLEGEASVAELAVPFSMTTRAVSKHIGVLEAAGLVSRGRDAQRRPSRIRAEPLADVDAWLGTYRKLWLGRFARLEQRLREQQPPVSPPAARGKKQKQPKGQSHGLHETRRSPSVR
jgi:DNA-binding transcriptional ArsR family regulator